MIPMVFPESFGESARSWCLVGASLPLVDVGVHTLVPMPQKGCSRELQNSSRSVSVNESSQVYLYYIILYDLILYYIILYYNKLNYILYYIILYYCELGIGH